MKTINGIKRKSTLDVYIFIRPDNKVVLVHMQEGVNCFKKFNSASNLITISNQNED